MPCVSVPSQLVTMGNAQLTRAITFQLQQQGTVGIGEPVLFTATIRNTCVEEAVSEGYLRLVDGAYFCTTSEKTPGIQPNSEITVKISARCKLTATCDDLPPQLVFRFWRRDQAENAAIEFHYTLNPCMPETPTQDSELESERERERGREVSSY
jgi:hypothetical protein